jgi:hypothetical protein
MPLLTTATELNDDSYNKPLEPPLPPLSVAPRFRSRHYVSSIAANKLRNDADARRAALGYPKPTFPAVAVLGLEGTSIASQVERILNGEEVVVQDAPSAKRRRESSSTGAKGKAKEAVTSAAGQALHSLPNPFAFGGAAAPPAPLPTMSPGPSGTASPAPQGLSMEGSQSPVFSDSFDEDDLKPHLADMISVPPPKKPRKQHKLDGLKPKKVRQHGITSGTFTIPHIPRNPDGTAKLPITAGMMLIKNLGCTASLLDETRRRLKLAAQTSFNANTSTPSVTSSPSASKRLANTPR